MRRLRLVTLLVSAALVAAACSSGTPAAENAPSPPAAATTSPSDLGVAVASFDLATEKNARFQAGVFTADRQLIIGGDVEMAFTYFGEDPNASALPGATTTGTFLPVPGEEPDEHYDQPVLNQAAQASGVYITHVDLDRPGYWSVTVTADVKDKGRLSGTAAFQVANVHQVPAVGDPAPTVDNLTMDSDAPAAAIDSRATTNDGAIPDEILHQTTVAKAIAAHRPVVVVLSTPVYCFSRFCGPVTDAVADLAGRYGDRADFVHIEIWKDFDNKQLNDAAATWIQGPSGQANEPWVFLVGADGTVQARWDNVLDKSALEQMLQDLPAS